jgi:hypothetical protein
MPMTVRELITKLKKLDPNSLVVVAADAEGNGYRPLWLVEEGFYNRTTPGRIYTEPDGGTSACIVLWPED